MHKRTRKVIISLALLLVVAMVPIIQLVIPTMNVPAATDGIPATAADLVEKDAFAPLQLTYQEVGGSTKGKLTLDGNATDAMVQFNSWRVQFNRELKISSFKISYLLDGVETTAQKTLYPNSLVKEDGKTKWHKSIIWAFVTIPAEAPILYSETRCAVGQVFDSVYANVIAAQSIEVITVFNLALQGGETYRFELPAITYSDNGTKSNTPVSLKGIAGEVLPVTVPTLTNVGADITVEAGDNFVHETTICANSAGLDERIIFEDTAGNLTTVPSVDTSQLGVYHIYYSAYDTLQGRSAEEKQMVTIVDTTAPVITLNGSAKVSVTLGASYQDAGAVATDVIDGTRQIAADNPAIVDTSTVGTYTLTYNAVDTAGNPSTEVTRTVTVTPKAVDPPGPSVDPPGPSVDPPGPSVDPPVDPPTPPRVTTGGRSSSGSWRSSRDQGPASTTSAQDTKMINKIKKLFNSYYKNKITVIDVLHVGELGKKITITAPLDTIPAAGEDLVFYVYDTATNTFRKIVEPNYSVTAAGIVSFETTSGRFIIISQGAL